ncbi:hypothetical protein KIPB_013097, partial [Kipferlia bialata]|eukprot:g13097.t1
MSALGTTQRLGKGGKKNVKKHDSPRTPRRSRSEQIQDEMDLGLARHEQGDNIGAEQAYSECMRLFLEAEYSDTPFAINLCLGLGGAQLSNNRVDAAQESFV